VTSSLDDLYRATILDHGKSPRNMGRLEAPTHAGECDNPLCGDRIRVEVVMEHDRVRAARFEITGCIIATASASLMTEAVPGRALGEVLALHEAIETTCGGRLRPNGEAPGALAALAGVRAYPSRARCATLPWEALARALAGTRRSES
jgi:nitrogen fixation NifU-like protein